MTQNERVKEIRKSLGLTLEKFGERIGVTRGSMSNIENGNRNLTKQMTKSKRYAFRCKINRKAAKRSY
jgi:transcriptional regulator with XRE-family HTH domain